MSESQARDCLKCKALQFSMITLKLRPQAFFSLADREILKKLISLE